MKIPVDEIPQSPKEITFSENIEGLNEIYRRSQHPEFRFPPTLDVNLSYYRSGADLFFNGTFHGDFTGSCGRCAEQYNFDVQQEFSFILTPQRSKTERGAEELHEGELGLSTYSGDEIDLSPLIAEQVILALPTRPLCSDQCRGLCESCGANLNIESCDCDAKTGDPRMAIFRNLKVGR